MRSRYMLSDILLIIIGAVALYYGLFSIANKMGKDKAKIKNKEYQIAVNDLSKDIKSEVPMDTGPVKSGIFNKPIKLNSCVMIKYGNRDYRYLDNLKEYGLEDPPSSIYMHVRKSKYDGKIKVFIHNDNEPEFYIDRSRLLKIDKDLYDRLVEVESLNAEYMSDYNQKNIDTLRELFKRIKYTYNEQIDKYIDIGRSLEYKFSM